MKRKKKKDIDKEIARLKQEQHNAIESVKRQLDNPYTKSGKRVEILLLFKRVWDDDTYENINKYQKWWKDLRRLAKDE